jgi:hypothetical protein
VSIVCCEYKGVSGSVVQRGGCEPKLDRCRGEWTMWIEQEIDEYKAEVLL